MPVTMWTARRIWICSSSSARTSLMNGVSPWSPRSKRCTVSPTTLQKRGKTHAKVKRVVLSRCPLVHLEKSMSSRPTFLDYSKCKKPKGEEAKRPRILISFLKMKSNHSWWCLFNWRFSEVLKKLRSKASSRKVLFRLASKK